MFLKNPPNISLAFFLLTLSWGQNVENKSVFKMNLTKLLNAYILNSMLNTEKNNELFLYYCISLKHMNAWNRYFHDTDSKVCIVRNSEPKRTEISRSADRSRTQVMCHNMPVNSTSSLSNWQMGEGSQRYVELTSCSYSKKIWKFLSLLRIGWDDSLCRKTSCTWTVFLNTARYSLQRKQHKWDNTSWSCGTVGQNDRCFV